MRRFAITLLCASFLLVPAAEADDEPTRRVFLNGIDLEGVEVPARVFKSCTVRFDKRGNVYITAPGFELETQEKKKDTRKRKPAKLTKRYFLITEENRRGATGYDVTIYINGDRITTVRAGRDPIAHDITEFMKPGDNKIRFLAKKRGDKKTGSADHYLQIQIGEGDVVKGQAVVRNTVLTYRRTAAEGAAFHDRFKIEGR